MADIESLRDDLIRGILRTLHELDERGDLKAGINLRLKLLDILLFKKQVR